MLTNKFIKLHNKCAAIMELIQTVNNRLSRATSDLYLYDNVPPLHTIRLFTTRTILLNTIAHLKKVRQRLICYYADTNMAIIEQSSLLSHAA